MAETSDASPESVHEHPDRSNRRLVSVAAGLVTFSIVAALFVNGSNPESSVESSGAAPVVATRPGAVNDTTPLLDPSLRTTTAPSESVQVTETVASRVAAPVVPATTAPPATAPPQNADSPSVVARPVPVNPPPPPPDAPAPPWAASTRTTLTGLVSTDVGCADDTSAAGLDRFFAQQVGPVLGWDYQHVVSLGANRALWLFQDTFIDHSGTATTLGAASFVHNVAMIEDNGCFTLLHRGSTTRPAPFEAGTGTATLSTWFWPMGGEVHDGRLHVFWVKMVKDSFDPQPPDGLGWHPTITFIASYDVETLARTDFGEAVNSGVTPVYGYALASDDTHTYLFGNTFEQNLTREGGYENGPHSATRVYLARVPRGRLFDAFEYRTADGWSGDAAAAVPILTRHWVEFPFQPRFIDGQWVGVAAVDGYWDERYSVDVAAQPWGPWTTIESRQIAPRNGDPKMNTYHAHLLPSRNGNGQLVVTISNNARDMLRDAWPRPDRYRPMVFNSTWALAPPPAAPAAPSTIAPTTTTPAATTTTTTIATAATPITTPAATRPAMTTTTTTITKTSTTTTTATTTTAATTTATTTTTTTTSTTTMPETITPSTTL